MAEPRPEGPRATDPEVPQDPWERYGWIMGAIWLVFLAFPLLGSVQADVSWWLRIASVLSILGFAAAYVAGFIKLDTYDTWDEVQRFGLRWLCFLAVFCVLPAMAIGADALGMLPFMVAFAMFSIDLRFAIALAVAAVIAAVLIPSALGLLNELWFFVLIVSLVSVTTGIIRVLEERGAKHRQLTEQMTIVTERERVARDVHDVLGHSLTVITVKSELARRMMDVDPDRARAELDEVMALSRTALAEVRATVSGLRVARLDDELAAAAAALSGADIAADLPDDITVVDPRHRIVLAWALREGITNVVRHSRAERCVVTLCSNGIVVEDDGVGLCADGNDRGNDPKGGNDLKDGNALKDGNGLRGLRERVAAVNGRLDIGPGTDGRGTRVEVNL